MARFRPLAGTAHLLRNDLLQSVSDPLAILQSDFWAVLVRWCAQSVDEPCHHHATVKGTVPRLSQEMQDSHVDDGFQDRDHEEDNHHEGQHDHTRRREQVEEERARQVVAGSETVQEDGPGQGETWSSPRWVALSSISISKLPVLSAVKEWVTLPPARSALQHQLLLQLLVLA